MAEITLHGKTYTKRAKIGRGSQGIVWQAENGGSRPVVLKELFGITADARDDPEVSDVKRQVAILKELQGVAGIPTLIDAGFADDERYYVAMNHIPGKTLEELAKEEKRYTKEEARRTLQQLLTTLEACHTRGLIHRDVKPDNIKMFEEQAIFVDVSSFGDALAKTQTIAIGTLGYVAPEQKELHAAPASDIYGLGKTMYRSLTREEVPALVELKATDFDGIRRVYGDGFGNILEKMCQAETTKRYKNVSEVTHDLEVGDVTERYAVAKREQTGIVTRWAARTWDWMRYRTQEFIYDEHGKPVGQTILKKRFGQGPSCLVVDHKGVIKYGSDKYDLEEAIVTNSERDFGILYKLIALNDRRYLPFRRSDGTAVLIAEDGEIFGKPFAEFPSSSIRRKQRGTTTDYVIVYNHPPNSTTLGIQFMGKDGFIGICHQKANELELYHPSGWTMLTHRYQNKDRRGESIEQALVTPDGEIVGNKWFEEISTSHAADSTKTTYFAVYDPGNFRLINQDGEVFGRRLEGNIETDDIKLTLSFEQWNGIEYAHLAWKKTPEGYKTLFSEETYIARDGSVLGNKEGWGAVTILQGINEQYAVCDSKNDMLSANKGIVQIVNKNNDLIFGGLHEDWVWYSPEGGLEAVCFKMTVEDRARYTGDIEEKVRKYEKVVVRDKRGNVLYLSKVEQERRNTYDHLCTIDQTAVVIEDQIIRKVEIHKLIEPGYISLKRDELRTQDGTILCAIQTPGNIVSYARTDDNMLSVLYSNGNRETIDVKKATQDPASYKPSI